MLFIILVRIAITLTFLILAAGGPYALIKLSRFIRRYIVAHEELKNKHEELKASHAVLKNRVQIIEQRLGITPLSEEQP